VIELGCLTYGVGHAEEGISLLLQIGSHRVLLDCGLADSAVIEAEPGVPPADVVFCSHAHTDHAQSLLRLHQAFPKLPIYASDITTQLLPLNWPQFEPAQLRFCQALPWRTPVEVLDGLSVALYPAGHLPGAAVIVLTYVPPASREMPDPRAYRVIYTGDCFLSNMRLVEGLPLDELRSLHPNVLIVDGSYGTLRHPHRRQQENQLAERINCAIAAEQSVLLPTPALGLGQELLMLLRSHHYFTGQDIDIWVDGQVAAGCDAYLELLPYLPSSVQNFARHQSLFWDERVRPRVRRLPPNLPETLGRSPCIVLTDETADFNSYLRYDPDRWLVLYPQEPHRHWGQPHPPIQLAAEPTQPMPPVAATATPSAQAAGVPKGDTYLLAQHCDGPGITQLIHNLRPQHVLFVHGSASYLADLAGMDEFNSRYHVHLPSAGSWVELPIGETFIQPPAPESTYEGSLLETDTGLDLTLPNEIVADPRWRAFTDTSFVTARWQGEELVLRGISQRELLLRQGGDRQTNRSASDAAPRSCCQTCLYYRAQRCRNPASPLFEFKVTPDGVCPVFEPL
jgi:Cft2 family RNA processing exonuclease